MKNYSYDIERDYGRVMAFLAETFNPDFKDSNWFPSRWEYMHYHPYFQKKEANKIGIWEHNDEIVAVVHFEMCSGEAYFEVRRGFEFLKEALFEYACGNLRGVDRDGKSGITLFINEDESGTETSLTDLAIRHSFKKLEKWSQPLSVFDFAKESVDYSLPEGFTICSLADDNDLDKLSSVLWRGFNRKGEVPEDSIDEVNLMQSAPNYDKRLNIVVKNPDGDFVSYAGIWYEKSANIAYVEPVATDPDFRRMGLGKAAVLESIRIVNGIYGADRVYVGTEMSFYLSFGFKKLYANYCWAKEF
jgi:predicted N-acetyltransferase YhbS